MYIAVVGGGITGLVAGLRLVQEGYNVTVFEEAEEAGGLASSFRAGDESLDRFYHHMFVNDSELLSLLDELSLTRELEWHEPKNAIFIDNKLYPFTSPLDLLKFKPLSFASRVRMGLLVLFSRFIRDYGPFESVSAREWIIKRSGSDAYEKVWGPLLKSKFDIDADNISGTWIWNKFKLRGSSRGKNISREKLGYLNGGFITLVKALEKGILQNGGLIMAGKRVNNLSMTGDHLWEVCTEDRKETFDRVLFTGAPELLSQCCPNLPADYKARLESIKYKANLCLVLELKESLSPYYWITISQQGLPFVLAIEHTNLVGKRGYGSSIVYLSRYLDPSDPLFNAPEDEITGQFLSGLEKVFPGFDQETVVRATLSRARYAQPVVSIGYQEILPYIKTPLPGLFLASMSQIYPEDRGLNYGVRLGCKAAHEIIKSDGKGL